MPAAIAAILTVVATYALLRAYDVLFKAEVDPALVIWSGEVAMFWRLAVGGYAAGAVALLVSLAADRAPRRTVKVVAWAVPIVAALITVQGIFLP